MGRLVQPHLEVLHGQVAERAPLVLGQLHRRAAEQGRHFTPGGCQIGGYVRPELDLWVALTPGVCQIGYMDHTVINGTVFRLQK
jgi:hypothetical protein